MTKILVTGGAGYLGSHTCVELTKIISLLLWIICCILVSKV